MTDVPASASAVRFEVRPTADTHFGWMLTRLALERTMTSWERTAIRLIGFGFAIVLFFDELQQMPGILPALHPDAPKYMGLGLISTGVLSLMMSIWQYRWTVRYLRSGSFACVAGLEGVRQRMVALQTPAIAVAILLIIIGLGAGTAVLFRVA